MRFSSSYELKRFLKRRGFDLEGFQVKEIRNGKTDFLFLPLDQTIQFRRNGEGWEPEGSLSADPDVQDLFARLNEISKELRGSNVEVGVVPQTTPEKPDILRS